MTDKKDSVFKKVLGVFVETDDAGDETLATEEIAPRKAPKSDPGMARAPQSRPAPPPRPASRPGMKAAAPPEAGDGANRFAAVYDRAGIDASQQERVTKALTLLAALPQAAPAETKRQIVEASLTAFGFPLAEIQASSEAEVAALDAFVASANDETESRLGIARGRIEELNAEIAAVKKSMDDVMATQARLVEATTRERERVNEVLAFFGTKG